MSDIVPGVTGSIPEKLMYVQKPPTVAEDYWEQAVGGNPPKVRVRPTFVVDAKNSKTMATAKKWAGTRGVTIKELPNDPIPVVELVTLEVRSMGGRAWKVLVHGLYYVDLREDVLRDAIVYGKGTQGKEIIGPFIWCSVAGGLKLVRVGSALHQAVLASMAKRAEENVGTSDLVVGGVYADSRGQKHLYLGQVNADAVRVKYLPMSMQARLRGDDPKVSVSPAKHRNLQLWGRYNGDWPLDSMMATYYLRIVKEASVKNLVKTVKLPANYLEMIREQSAKRASSHLATCKSSLKKEWRSKGSQGPMPVLKPEVYHEVLAKEFRFSHIHAVGEPVPDHKNLFQPLLDHLTSLNKGKGPGVLQ